VRLTDLCIQRLPPPMSGQKTYFEANGFGIRVSQGGTKSFVVMYGKDRRLATLGRYPSVSLKIARTQAKRLLATVRPDPSEISASEARSAFLSHCQTKNRPRTVKDYTRHLTLYLPEGRLSLLTRPKLLSIFQSLSHKPGEQSHAFVTTTVFLNWCVTQGYLDQNPIAGVRGIGRTNQRDRVLSTEELTDVLKKSLMHPYPFGAIVTLCILTGMRRTEVSDIENDFIKDGTITLPSTYTKNKREHIFPYATFTASILADLPRFADSQYLFPGRGDGPWNGWSKAKLNFDKTHTVTNYTLHDLRRTYASIHAQLGTPIHVIEKLLNHASGSFAGVAGIYNRYQYLDEMKAACQRYENYLHSLCS